MIAVLEPVVVTVGEDGWARRCRLADVLITDGVTGDVTAIVAALLDAYPGLTMVLVPLPGNRTAVGSRDGRLRVLRTPATAEVAAVLYLAGSCG